MMTMAVVGARQLRVWSREGVLHSTSEQADGLGQAVAFKYVDLAFFYSVCATSK